MLVRVDILRAQRRYLESKEELRKAASSWPDDLRIRREQATLAFIAHEYAEARPLLEDLLKHEPDSAELNLLLGESWLDSKEPAKAIPCSREGRPCRSEALLRARAVLGRAYVEAGQAERAVPHLEAALPTDEDGSLHFQLARAYRETGRTDQAARTLEAFQEMRRPTRPGGRATRRSSRSRRPDRAVRNRHESPTEPFVIPSPDPRGTRVALGNDLSCRALPGDANGSVSAPREGLGEGRDSEETGPEGSAGAANPAARGDGGLTGGSHGNEPGPGRGGARAGASFV